jgi:hypothetical protein
MAIELIDKIKPKNNGTFPMVDAVDVLMPNGKRLSEVTLGEGGGDCQLPGVTAEDNGKIPQVVDGALVYTDVASLTVGETTLEAYIADSVNNYIEEALGGDY